jgi:hypothetical protein
MVGLDTSAQLTIIIEKKIKKERFTHQVEITSTNTKINYLMI